MLLAQENLQQESAERLKILVLCTGNSARSIMAEALFNSIGSTRFHAFSAGSNPTGLVNPLALEQIEQLGFCETSGLRSKSWSEFAGQEAPQFDAILTVCDSAAAEQCPFYAANCHNIHWSLSDPAGSSIDEAQERAAFSSCFETLKARIEELLAVPASRSCHSEMLAAMSRYL